MIPGSSLMLVPFKPRGYAMEHFHSEGAREAFCGRASKEFVTYVPMSTPSIPFREVTNVQPSSI